MQSSENIIVIYGLQQIKLVHLKRKLSELEQEDGPICDNNVLTCSLFNDTVNCFPFIFLRWVETLYVGH
jgi:hypothetical protein